MRKNSALRSAGCDAGRLNLDIEKRLYIEFSFGDRSDYVQLGPLVTPDKQCHWLRKHVPNGSDLTDAAMAKRK